MNISRYLSPELVRLGLVSGHLDEIDPEKDGQKERERLKHEVVEELLALFDQSGEIRNLSKFRKDFIDRESSGSTAIEGGIAFPHVRSLQPRKTVIVFARSRDGVWFDAADGKLTHLFFGITAPAYDDQDFFKFHKWIAQAFLNEEWLYDALLAAENEHEIIRTLGKLQ